MYFFVIFSFLLKHDLICFMQDFVYDFFGAVIIADGKTDISFILQRSMQADNFVGKTLP